LEHYFSFCIWSVYSVKGDEFQVGRQEGEIRLQDVSQHRYKDLKELFISRLAYVKFLSMQTLH